MSNISFFDSSEVIPLPPEEVRLVELRAEPYPEGQRLRVTIEITPFQQRPWLEVTLFDADDEEVASANIIEPLNWKIEFTMHIKRNEPQGKYTLKARLYYPEKPDNDQKTIGITVGD